MELGSSHNCCSCAWCIGPDEENFSGSRKPVWVADGGGVGEPWSTFAVAAHYDFRDIYATPDEIEVSYDFGASFLSPLDIIPIKIHLTNRIAGQGAQFIAAIFVEAPTGIIIGRLRGGDGKYLNLGTDESFDDTVSYRVPLQWQGYDLRFHPIVWMDNQSRPSYYRPFLAWTLPSIVTMAQQDNPWRDSFSTYLVWH